MTVLLGAPGGATEFREEETRALGVLADAGLVPPLRMVRPDDGEPFGKTLRVV